MRRHGLRGTRFADEDLRRTIPTRRRRGRPIWSSGSSPPSGRTSCGSQIYVRGDLEGVCLRAFVIDVFSPQHRRLEGISSVKPISYSTRSSRPLHARSDKDGLVHHATEFSIAVLRYQRAACRVRTSGFCGTTGGFDDKCTSPNPIIGSTKPSVIRRRGPWRNVEDGEFATHRMGRWLTTAASSSRSATTTCQEIEQEYYGSHESLNAIGGMTQQPESPEFSGGFTHQL